MSSYHDSSSLTDAADAQFVQVAHECLDDYLQRAPDTATALGDHRFDGQLPDLSDAGRAEFVHVLNRRLEQLDAIDDTELGHDALLDFETLRSTVSNLIFEAEAVQRPTWDPLVWNPGNALWSLVSRPALSDDELAIAVRGRLASIPEWLAQAQRTLGDVSRVHAETALVQLAGTQRLVDSIVNDLEARQSCDAAALARPREQAQQALSAHIGWLQGRLESIEGEGRSPRFGEQLFAATLWHRLDGGPDVSQLRRIAHRAFEDTAQAIVEVAAMYLGKSESEPDVVRRALADVADCGPVTAESILSSTRDIMTGVTEFVREHDMVSIPSDPIHVTAMPEIHRGIAVAYCDAPGPLETAELPTLFSVAPPPDEWSQERKDSFYREYNAHMLHSLCVHEGIPGHALQLAHARHALPRTSMRHILRNYAFAEGWAVYTEELFAIAEYPGVDVPNGALAWQLTWLKTRLRAIANTLLDIGVHVDGMQEADAMDLLVNKAFQEQGEAVGKWRRSLLTAGQLSTYFAGYIGVRAIADDLRAMHPEFSERQVHDTMLAFGTPSTRVLRLGLGLPDLVID